MNDNTVAIDAPRVRPDVALELMVHHLQLAAMYFEAIPEGPASFDEMVRLLREDERALAGAREWYDAINQFYEEMKDRDDD